MYVCQLIKKLRNIFTDDRVCQLKSIIEEMKVHFIASTVNLKTDINSYRLIINALKKQKVQITSDWLEKAYERIVKSSGENVLEASWQDIYRENIDAISKADIIVAEVGNKSFLVGFQVAFALQMKKPILLLSKLDKVDSALGVSLNEEIIRYSQYSDNNVEDIINAFIEENRRGGKDIRFNFFINRRLLNYLNWASFQEGKTKSEIIRKILTKEMNRSDFK